MKRCHEWEGVICIERKQRMVNNKKTLKVLIDDSRVRSCGGCEKIISSPLNQAFLCNISTLNFINFTHVWIEKLFLLKLTFVYIAEEVKSWHYSSILYKGSKILCFRFLWISEMFHRIHFIYLFWLVIKNIKYDNRNGRIFI